MSKPKLIVIVGPTGAGKTALGVFLAKKFSGEIVSADSRQVYKELSIGTAKPEGHWEHVEGARHYVAGGVVHHLIDERDPKEEFSLPNFKKRAEEAIADSVSRGKVPFLVGGTGQYVYALLENWQIPEVRPNEALRTRLKKISSEDLDAMVRAVDPTAADTADMNARRLIRALEIYEETGKKPSEVQSKGPALFETLKLGVPLPASYEEVVRERVEEMLNKGLTGEITELVKTYSWELPAMQSIDYQEFKDYVEGKETLEQAKEKAVQAHLSFAKRQMTWFKRDKDIHWVSSPAQAEILVEKFIYS